MNWNKKLLWLTANLAETVKCSIRAVFQQFTVSAQKQQQYAPFSSNTDLLLINHKTVKSKTFQFAS